ncbi:MAG TPA: RNA polymerase sigma factor [Candidatus Kapabacteria bacterium]|jgi:RNA polymerase sigma-70 factor (ECF subfamily)
MEAGTRMNGVVGTMPHHFHFGLEKSGFMVGKGMEVEPLERPDEVSAELPDDSGRNRPMENLIGAPDADTEAFNRFLSGNDEAFRALYDAYERPIYLYIVRLLGSKSDAEDIFQDVWVRMYRLRGERESIQKFGGLIFTVARNLSLNAIRDRKLQPNISLEDTSLPELVGRSGNPDELDLRDMLERALLQIPVAQREAFILREYFGYSYDEVASIMGTPMVTSKTRAWRARESLRKVISAWLELKKPE